MLAEDNSLNRQVAEYVLCDAGAEVVAVVNGLEAIKTFAKAPTGTFDFVIMDVRMPEMDALEANAEDPGIILCGCEDSTDHCGICECICG
ncbi:MAG: response regulator [Eubacteriales bacterium]|nr:response regulator [Eubacteriales bacterium]